MEQTSVIKCTLNSFNHNESLLVISVCNFQTSEAIFSTFTVAMFSISECNSNLYCQSVRLLQYFPAQDIAAPVLPSSVLPFPEFRWNHL